MNLTIGEVARRAGIRTSTVRYYESIGLLPEPPRTSGQRRYDESIVQQLALIHTAQAAGFTLAELRVLLTEILPGSTPPGLWRDLIGRKRVALDELLADVRRMQTLLDDITLCDDADLIDCIVTVGELHARDHHTEPKP